MRGTVADAVVQQSAQRVVFDTRHGGYGVDDEAVQQLALVRPATPVLSGRTPKPSSPATVGHRAETVQVRARAGQVSSRSSRFSAATSSAVLSHWLPRAPHGLRDSLGLYARVNSGIARVGAWEPG